MNSPAFHCLSLFVGLSLCGCAVGPNYQGRPEVEHAEKFAGAGRQASAPDLDKTFFA